MQIEFEVLPKQTAFLQSTSKITIYRGGIRSGKTFVLCVNAILRAMQGRRQCIVSFSYPMLRDVVLDTCLKILDKNEIPFQFHKQEMTLTVSREKILLRSGDDPDSLRGTEFSDCSVDEARNFTTDYIIDILMGRLSGSPDGQIFIATTPHGKDWVYKLGEKPETLLITQKTGENTFLHGNFVADLKARYSGEYFRQEVEADIVDTDTGIFRIGWWKMFDTLPPGVPIRTVQSWDTAFKAGTENDESVCTTWAQFKDGFYLVDVLAERMEYPALKAAMRLQASIHSPDVILVEDKASGQSLIQEMRTESSLPILPIKVDSDKITRAHASTPMIEAGHVHVKAGARWLRKFTDQMTAFPHDKHDDIVDSVTQFINWVRRQGSRAPTVSTRSSVAEGQATITENRVSIEIPRHHFGGRRPSIKSLTRGYL